LLSGWVVQGVAQRPWGVEEDLALLMHFRDRSQLHGRIAQLMSSSPYPGADWCIRRVLQKLLLE
jgi:hypothetical protein